MTSMRQTATGDVSQNARNFERPSPTVSKDLHCSAYGLTFGAGFGTTEMTVMSILSQWKDKMLFILPNVR